MSNVKPVSLSSTYTGTRSQRDIHIVDVLIEERAVNLMQRPTTWRMIRKLGDGILGYDKAIRMADKIAPMRGHEVFAYMSDLLKLNLSVSGLEHVPKTGATIVTPNHPAGIADGIAVYDALKETRKDIIFVANRDAIRVSPGLRDTIIPVEWRDELRTATRNRETISALIRAIKKECLIVIFPSGRLAQPTIKGLKERPWQITALNLAQKYQINVLPMHITGRNTFLYYLSWYINSELKDITIFRELLHKTKQKYTLSIGEPFRVYGDVAEQTEKLRSWILTELKQGNTKFR